LSDIDLPDERARHTVAGGGRAILGEFPTMKNAPESGLAFLTAPPK
jgi:hypothetical protein